MKIIAKILLFDNQDRILVLRRSSTHPNFAFHSDFPGGEVDNNEEPDSAIKREVFEETGLRVSDAKLVSKKYIVEEDATILLFEGRLKDAEPNIKLSWEHDRAEWLSLDELKARPIPEDVCPDYETVLEYIN